MTFKDGENYYGVFFNASSFVDFASKIGLLYTFHGCGIVEIPDECISGAIRKGLEVFHPDVLLEDASLLPSFREAARHITIFINVLNHEAFNNLNKKLCQQ